MFRGSQKKMVSNKLLQGIAHSRRGKEEDRGGNILRGMITKIGQKIRFSVKSKQYFSQTSCASQFLCAYNLKSCLEYNNVKKSTFWAIIYKKIFWGGHFLGEKALH